MAQNKRFEENKRKAQVIQKKLLALANHQTNAVEDQQPEKNGTRKVEESTPPSEGNTVK